MEEEQAKTPNSNGETPENSNGETPAALNSPAQSQGNLNQLIAQSLELAAQNAVVAQQQGNILHQAATIVGITQLYSSTLGSTVDQNLLNTLEKIQEVAEILKNQDSSQDNQSTKSQ